MSISSGFEALRQTANAEPEAVEEAGRRRDVFKVALERLDDVIAVIPSGSFARRTHKDPIHDVDLLVEFDPAHHGGWVQAGPSAGAALEHTRSETKRLLGNFGEDGKEVRIAGLRNHSVKCFIDLPGVADAFTVDLTPAIRRAGGGLWIPERKSENWVSSDPEKLIRLVADRHSDWNRFRPLVRILKLWNAAHERVMKSLVVEVLALHHLLPSEDQGQLLQHFFAVASTAVLSPVCDPTGHCGDIQSELDRQKASDLLAEAADLAWRANSAAGRGDTATAQCLWNQVFGTRTLGRLMGAVGRGPQRSGRSRSLGW